MAEGCVGLKTSNKAFIYWSEIEHRKKKNKHKPACQNHKIQPRVKSRGNK